ncbi:MAG: hypothetical protein NT069_30130, partial [Planctomycetota bacterium]|nr:hypothetical protein [Planctomycetota bacterium]
MAPPLDSDARRQLVRQLAGSIRQVETAAELGRREAVLEGTVPLPAEETSPFERLLPNGQLPVGGLLEVLAEGGGSGGVWLALHLAVGGGAVVLIDVDHELYPPALAGLGFDFTRTIVVRPKSLSEGTWAFEQALRCPGVGAVWCRNQKWNDRVFRRLQLTAEAGGGLG